jgi:TFIIF-interacting CTD phosphatase-like protein
MVDINWTKPYTRKLIIFDLDETLAHCVRHNNPIKEPDVFLQVPTPSGKLLNAGFNIRPFIKEILEVSNRHFEVCVFTASNPGYADTILNHLDPDRRLI